MTMEIVDYPVGKITPYENNPRDNDDAVPAVRASIEAFGWQQPIVVDEDGVIVVGHTRYKAALEMGLETVPVKVAHGLTEEQCRAYRLADNRTHDLSGWLDAMLAEELAQIEGMDMAEFGFEMPEVDLDESFGMGMGDGSEDDAPDVDEVEPTVKRGQIWRLGDHVLMCGDSTSKEDVDRLMQDGDARLCVTSPPYGVGMEYEEKGIGPWRATIEPVVRNVTRHALIVVWNIGDLYATEGQFIEPTSMYSTEYFDAQGFGLMYSRLWKKPGANFNGVNPYHLVSMKPVQEYEWILGYAKRDYYPSFEKVQKKLRAEADKAKLDNDVLKEVTGAGFMYGHWFTMHQFAMIDEDNYRKIQRYCEREGIDAFRTPYDEIRREFDDLNVFQKTLTDEERREWGQWAIWEIPPVPTRDGHPAAYPVELPSRAIRMHSRPGDTILDPFGGSGTTLMACEQTQRRCRMMELDPRYCDVIIARWEKATGRKAELVEEPRWRPCTSPSARCSEGSPGASSPTWSPT